MWLVQAFTLMLCGHRRPTGCIWILPQTWACAAEAGLRPTSCLASHRPAPILKRYSLRTDFTMSAALTWLRISNIWAQSSENLPRDLFGCWSRKWIFYSWLVWSITYKLLLYFVAHGREVLVGEVMDKTKGNLNEDNKKTSSRWDNLKWSTLKFFFFLLLAFGI